MNPDLSKLQPYPFERLALLKQDTHPPADRAHIPLSIGEPRHPTPPFIAEAIARHIDGLSNYPLTRGTAALREAIAHWLSQRFDLGDKLDPELHVLPVNGTREALFAFAQTVVDRNESARVLMPNPFYQIYEGATLLAGARPFFLATEEQNGFLPDYEQVPESVWRDCQLLYVCSPGNPTGAVSDQSQLQQLIQLADRYDFVIASDECYSEIYFDEARPPAGLLGAAAAMGNDRFERCVVFHSLSKRSNAPGLRSGFVAGDAEIMKRFLLYRTYHGCAMALPVQHASIQAWEDEQHVRENRSLYRAKFEAVMEILAPVLDVRMPDAGFYLWPRTPNSDTEFARELFASQNVTVLPGSFLSRPGDDGSDPGANRVRMALVASLQECTEAARRIRAYLESR